VSNLITELKKKKTKEKSLPAKYYSKIVKLLSEGKGVIEIAKRLRIKERLIQSKVVPIAQEYTKEAKILSAEHRIVKRELDVARVKLEKMSELRAEVFRACESLRPLPMVYKPIGTSKTVSSATLTVSDWHIGEAIKATEIEGMNEFNYQIAEARVRMLGERFLHNIETMRTGFRIDELHILAVGDFIAGNIHQELLMYAEFPPPTQAVKAGRLLGALVHYLSPHFTRIFVECNSADNHGRLFPKPMAKGKSENNFNVVTFSVAEALCERLDNVTFHLHPGMKHVVKIQNTRFLTQHGDVIRGWMGLPHYGIEREKNREKAKRIVIKKIAELKADIGFDVMVIGHFHAFGWEEEIIRNGSLSGTGEYDHASGRFATPHQVSFLVHPKWGVHTFNRWVLA
jgi:hypothetical protein